ncbi:MAG: hypothetical protein Salg2KO_13630 [Salibacteraceae bacterium]
MAIHAQEIDIYHTSHGLVWQLDEANHIYELLQYGDTISDVNRLEKHLKKMRAGGDTLGSMRVKLSIAEHYYQIAQDANAISIATQVANNSAVIGPEVAFEANRLLRNLYLRAGQLDRASEFHSRLDWKNADRDDWESNATGLFTSLALFYYGEGARAIQRLEKEVSRLDPTTLEYLVNAYSLAVIYGAFEKTEDARSLYNELLDLLEAVEPLTDTKRTDIRSILYGNLGELHVLEDNCLMAIPLINLELGAAHGPTYASAAIRNRLRSFALLTHCELTLGHLKEAAISGRKMDMVSEKLPDGPYLNLINLVCFKVNQSLGKTDEALLYLKNIVLSGQGAMFNTQPRQASENGMPEVELTVLANNEEWKAEIEQLNNALMRERWSKNMLGVVLIVLAAVLGIALQSLWRWSKRDRKLMIKNRLIREQTAQIRKALDEKDLLLREVHHRVKNNLQIISSLFYLQSKKIDNEQARNLIKEGQSRIEVMALIHQRLYQSDQLSTIDLQNYINDLGKQIIQTHSKAGLSINLSIVTGGAKFAVDRALPLGMIVNELITNSIKHGFEGRKIGLITVEFSLNGPIARLTYTDDGIGVSDIRLVQESNSLGMKLIKLLTDQLNGVIEYYPSDGFKMSLEFDA